MLKIIALGTLGYIAYRYIQRADQTGTARQAPRLAGGPLSRRATVQPIPDALPPEA
jgi:hypothetical protein